MTIMQETYGLKVGDKIVYKGDVYVIMEDDNDLMPLVQDEKGEDYYFDLTEFEWERYKEQTRNANCEGGAIRIRLASFRANDPDLKLTDVIDGLRAGVNEKGVVNVHFCTKDKYVKIDGATYWCPEYSGEVINITPHIDNEPMSYVEYIMHKDYYQLSLIVDYKTMGGKYFKPVVIPLKHEYFISYVPDDAVMNYDCLGDVELIKCEE